MKALRIFFCLMFVFAIAACNGKKSSVYNYSDVPETKKGEIGDPCTQNSDCMDGLVCTDKACAEPSTETDEDSDVIPDSDDTDSGSDTDDSDSGSHNDGDTGTDDGDTGTDDGDTGTDDGDTDTDDSDTDTHERVPECGDGIIDPGEICDKGFANSDEPGNYSTCRKNCTYAACGDGIKDLNEDCDDGNLFSGDYCRSDCQAITGYCGDGIEQINENCDSKNNPYCSSDCQTIIGSCGDGKIQANERCDKAEPEVGDGEGIGPFYCSTDCKEILGKCGDGRLQGEEDCDDGELNGRYGYCNRTCNGWSAACGDGILQRENCAGYGEGCVVTPGANEVCDDGNTEDGDYCSKDCRTSFGSCGDGTIQDFEKCDKAPKAVGEGQGIGAYCREDCQEILGRCGDRIVLAGVEQCDRGDAEEGGQNGETDCPYNSTAPCTVCTIRCEEIPGQNRYCGDGTVSSIYGEVCDKAQPGFGGGEGIGAYCREDCKKILGSCGDGIIQRENCEGYGENCKVTPGVNEVCEPSLDPYCTSDCLRIEGYCGDGIQNGNEDCDKGTALNGTIQDCDYGQTECQVCDADCKLKAGTPHYCGDGTPDRDHNEICDEGNTANGGHNGEYNHCNAECSGFTFCNDGIIQREDCTGYEDKGCVVLAGADEECDNMTNNGKTECQYGEESCTVCSSECKNTAGTVFHYCGDGHLDLEKEECDDGNKDDGDYCSSKCKKSGSCGDGILQTNEICDKADPSVGNGDGIGAYCRADCQEELGRCGDGSTLEGVETCDQGDALNGKYQKDAPGHCNSNCRGFGEGGYCGDGTQQDEEECEHGGNIQIYCDYNDRTCQVCTSDCTLGNGRTAYCGDGIIQREDCTGYEDKGCVPTPGAYETCDQGDEFNGKYGGFCNSECKGTTPRCRDGILQRTDCTGYEDKGCEVFEGADEECDEGDFNGAYQSDKPGHCNYNCKGYGEGGYCGNGIEEPGETCDNGELLNGKYGLCNTGCNGYAAHCSDGIIQREDCTGYEDKGCVQTTGAHEECDDGIVSEGGHNGEYNHCNDSCSAAITCGDGIFQREDCTGYEDKGCVQTPGANEECDEGDDNGTYLFGGSGHCDTSCLGYGEGGYCGDGIFQREDCTGYEDKGCVQTPGANEGCDDGDQNGGYDRCGTNCQPEGEGGYCGDGILQREDCTGYEDKNCVPTTGINEECDEGNVANGGHNGEYNHCNTKCTNVTRCGDGNEDPGETCDQGMFNGKYGSYCNKTCSGWTGYCNDGKIQRVDCYGYENCEEYETEFIENDEECDDGTLFNGRYEHCNDTCSSMRPEKCGDGILQRENCEGYSPCDTVPGANEICDDGIVSEGGHNGEFGYCNTNCTETVDWRCGDGTTDWDRGENCDEGDGVNGTYLLNAPGHCNSNCIDKGEGGYCGDGRLQREDCTGYEDKNCVPTTGANEKCDDGGNNGTEGFCDYDCSGPTPVCGNGVQERGETCDEGSLNGTYNHCNSNCFGQYEAGYCGDRRIQRGSLSDCGTIPACENSNDTNCCQIVTFAPGDKAEECDEGFETRGYHGHCNNKCSGFSRCGDDEVGPDEICESETTLNPALPCGILVQFSSGGTISTCDDKCMPNINECSERDSYNIPFFSTHQTLCYHESGTITCPASGDGFYGQSPQFNYLEQNFTDESATVVYESQSETYWQKKTPASYDTYGSACTFEDALAYCENSTDGGYDDWRLPSAFEFPIIADFGSKPHLHSAFEDTKNDFYWTAEGAVFSADNGTLTQMYQGTAQVKCVRKENDGSCPACKTNFWAYTFDDSIITYYENGMFPAYTFWYFGPKDEMYQMDWQHALIFCKNADNGNGLSNMRLPTVNELITLINSHNGKPLIPDFSGSAWTSTTRSEVPAEAYAVNFDAAALETDAKTNSNFVICVE